ncbi:hypothetical protein GEMRC1_001783 [Eukaryota sp. GEM-RC1]
MAAGDHTHFGEVLEELTDVTIQSPSHSQDTNSLSTHVSILKSSTIESQVLTTIRNIRHTVSTNGPDLETNIAFCINQGIIPHLISLLESSNAELCFESAWVLTNFASTSDSAHTHSLVNAGGLEALFKCMINTTHTNIKDQCCWGLGNIAGENAQCAELFLTPDYIKAIASTVQRFIELDACTPLSNATWMMANIFRWKLFDDLDIYAPLVEVCKKIFSMMSKYMEGGFHNLVESLLWVFCYLGDVFAQSYPNYLTKELTFAIGALIHDSNAIIINVALRFIGNVFSDCCPFVTEMVDELDLIIPLCKILDPSRPLKKKKRSSLDF